MPHARAPAGESPKAPQFHMAEKSSCNVENWRAACINFSQYEKLNFICRNFVAKSLICNAKNMSCIRHKMLRKSYRRLKVAPWFASMSGPVFQSTDGVTPHDY
jgi:hypothetical protein